MLSVLTKELQSKFSKFLSTLSLYLVEREMARGKDEQGYLSERGTLPGTSGMQPLALGSWHVLQAGFS